MYISLEPVIQILRIYPIISQEIYEKEHLYQQKTENRLLFISEAKLQYTPTVKYYLDAKKNEAPLYKFPRLIK